MKSEWIAWIRPHHLSVSHTELRAYYLTEMETDNSWGAKMIYAIEVVAEDGCDLSFLWFKLLSKYSLDAGVTYRWRVAGMQ